MKKFLTLTIFAALFVSCSTEIFDIEEDGATHFLKLNTIAEKGEITYPLELYAYSGDELAGELRVESSSDEIAMNLPTGVYDVYAVSGSTDFSNGGYATEPLMIGKSSVTLDKSGVQSSITMKYAVARLNVTLTDVPENITEVKLSVGNLHNNIDKTGKAIGSSTILLQCHKQDGMWLSDTIYVLPSVGDNVTLEISHGYSDNGQKTSFSYEYPYPIQAGYPYNFKGSYTSGITMAKLSLAVDIEGWGEEKECSFAFGEGANKDDYVTPSDASIFHVNDLPTACSEWNGHVVATIDEEGNALLFSLEEWSDVSSADEGAENPTEASTIASGYIEDYIGGWSIPTEDDMKLIRQALLKKVSKDGLVEISQNADKIHFDENYYYLCNDATNKFCLFNSTKCSYTNITNKYFLRLVKPVKFILNE